MTSVQRRNAIPSSDVVLTTPTTLLGPHIIDRMGSLSLGGAASNDVAVISPTMIPVCLTFQHLQRLFPVGHVLDAKHFDGSQY